MFNAFRITSCTLLALALVHVSAVAEMREVTAVGKAVISGSTTYDQARTQALHQARTLAVESAAGVNVNSMSIIKDNLMLVDLVKTFSHGFLVKEDSLTWTGTWAKESDDAGPGYPVIEVALKGVVKVQPKSFYRNYALTADLNKQLFHDGERATITINAREDLYIVIANYTSKSTIIPIFPTPRHQNNLVKAGSTLIVPNDKQDKYNLVVTNYADHQRDAEAFIILGFQKNTKTDSIRWPSIFRPGREMDYADFFHALTELPIQSLAEKTLVYTVSAGKP